jgi:hypothetical protein
MLENHSTVAPTMESAHSAGITLDDDVEQQLLSEAACSDGLPTIPLPETHMNSLVGNE